MAKTDEIDQNSTYTVNAQSSFFPFWQISRRLLIAVNGLFWFQHFVSSYLLVFLRAIILLACRVRGIELSGHLLLFTSPLPAVRGRLSLVTFTHRPGHGFPLDFSGLAWPPSTSLQRMRFWTVSSPWVPPWLLQASNPASVCIADAMRFWTWHVCSTETYTPPIDLDYRCCRPPRVSAIDQVLPLTRITGVVTHPHSAPLPKRHSLPPVGFEPTTTRESPNSAAP